MGASLGGASKLEKRKKYFFLPSFLSRPTQRKTRPDLLAPETRRRLNTSETKFLSRVKFLLKQQASERASKQEKRNE